MAFSESSESQIQSTAKDSPQTPPRPTQSDSVFSLNPCNPQYEARSPFASPVWSRPPGTELGVSRSLPLPIRRDLVLSPCFHARQLSFQDWCFNPANSAEQQAEKKPKQLPSLPTAASDLTLKPEVCLQPDRPSISRLQVETKSGSMVPVKRRLQHTNDPQETTNTKNDASEVDLEDLLSCKEVLSSSHPLEYELQPAKRRRSCYAF